MLLTLEVIAPPAAKLGAARRVFGPAGGTIGRREDPACDWVLPDGRVSNLHAVISFRNGAFFIEDRSSNGVCLNSPSNRLVRGQPFEISSGDRLLIGPYEIQVSVASEPGDVIARPYAAEAPGRQPPVQHVLDGDPFAPRTPAPEPVVEQEVDPLKLIDVGPRPPSVRGAPSAKDLAAGSPLDGHFEPPPVTPVMPVAPPPGALPIPADYDPLQPTPLPWTPPPPRVPEHVQEIEPIAPPVAVAPPVGPVSAVTPVPAAPPAGVGVATPPHGHPAGPYEAPGPPLAPVAPGAAVSPDLAAVLAGAGLDPSLVTAELANTFGQILRVVVAGVMDVLRARQQIKDEFRMDMTHFKAADNNPLKFSANVEDALHNLLVKRNAAYFGPVEAFEDAFEDLRDHQVAMLAGMRVAFESMLAQFDPDRLQERFDRQMKGGSLLNLPAKMRYWDLYRDNRDQMLKDPETSFRRLFGEEFARAYEEQLQLLKAGRRVGTGARRGPRRPER